MEGDDCILIAAIGVQRNMIHNQQYTLLYGFVGVLIAKRYSSQ